jgi:hypothetical protein
LDYYFEIVEDKVLGYVLAVFPLLSVESIVHLGLVIQFICIWVKKKITLRKKISFAFSLYTSKQSKDLFDGPKRNMLFASL